jgi:DNA-binding XRE family transcriptional regulator
MTKKKPRKPSLKNALIEGRFRREISQDALASLLGVSRATVGAMERGKVDSAFSIVKKASNVLGFSLDTFLPLR